MEIADIPEIGSQLPYSSAKLYISNTISNALHHWEFAATFLHGHFLSCIDLKMGANFKLHGANYSILYSNKITRKVNLKYFVPSSRTII